MNTNPLNPGRQQTPVDHDATQADSAKRGSSLGSWIVTLPLAAAAAAYIMLGFLPGRKAIGELEEQIKLKQDFVAQTAGVTPALRVAREKLAQAKSYNAAWHKAAPDRDGLSALYGTINQLAGAAGTTTTRFDPEPVEELETIAKVPISVGFTGSFSQVFQFLHSLESLPQTIWVESFRLGKDDGNGGVVSGEIRMVVFANNSKNSDYVGESE